MQWHAPHRLLRSSSRNYSSHNAWRPLNIIFFGRETFSCEAFNELHLAKDLWSTLSVATTPDQLIGRRRKELSISPLKKLSESLGIPVFEIPSSDEAFASWIPGSISSGDPSNALVTASFGRAIPASTLDFVAPSLRLNIHPSLLPKYRGAAPIQRTIIDGGTETGVSILQMEDVSINGFDAGPVWAQRRVSIPPRTTYARLEAHLAQIGGRLLVDHLRHRRDASRNLEILPIEQDESLATKARMITAETARVRWDRWDADKLDRIHRAVGHQRALHTTLPNGASVKLLNIQPASPPEGHTLSHPGDATYDRRHGAILVRCAGDSFIAVSELQTENRRATVAHEWWNGVGEMLCSRVLRLGISKSPMQ